MLFGGTVLCRASKRRKLRKTLSDAGEVGGGLHLQPGGVRVPQSGFARGRGTDVQTKELGSSGRAAFFTESQNVWGWQGPLWVTQPNALPKQGHPEQAAQHRVQGGLEYLQRRRLHSPSGQPVHRITEW